MQRKYASSTLVSSCICINRNDSWTFHGCLTLSAISTLSDCVHKITVDLLQGHTLTVCVCRSRPHLKRSIWSWRVFWVCYCGPYWKLLTGPNQQDLHYDPKFKTLRWAKTNKNQRIETRVNFKKWNMQSIRNRPWGWGNYSPAVKAFYTSKSFHRGKKRGEFWQHSC